MLDAMRRGAQGWVAKFLFGVLVLSFAVWGIADVFRGFGQSALAKVGDTEISNDQFQRAYQNEIDRISREARERITAEQARAFGLDRQVLNRLVATTAVENHAKTLNLGLSDETMAEAIRKDPNLKDIDGKFNRQQFDGFLRQVGLTERGFFAIRRQEELREQLTGALASSIATPKPMIDLLHNHKEETRIIQHFTIDADKAVKVADPDEAKLKEVYEQNKRQFMTPEFRKLAVLILAIDDIKKGITVKDDEVKAAFEAEKENYGAPEKRRVQQLAFKDKAAAEAARKKIQGGASVADIAKEIGATDKDTDLGLVTKRQLIDPKIADAAFKLEKDKISEPVEGRFSTVLLMVKEIVAGKEPNLDEVKERIRDRLATQRAKSEIQKLHDTIDDNRGAGKTLKDIGTSMKLPFFEVAATDKSNKAPDGKRALDVVNGDVVVSSAFGAKAGVESDAIELPDGGYAWADVLATTPEAQKPLDDVKADVKAVYLDAERRKQLSDFAAKLIERAKAGEGMAKLAGEAGGKLEQTLPVTRATVPQGLTKSAVAQAFVLAKGGAGASDTADGKSRIVFRIDDVKAAPPPTKEQTEQIAKDLNGQLQNDAFAAYITALQDRLGVSINEQILKRLTGAATDQSR